MPLTHLAPSPHPPSAASGWGAAKDKGLPGAISNPLDAGFFSEEGDFFAGVIFLVNCFPFTL